MFFGFCVTFLKNFDVKAKALDISIYVIQMLNAVIMMRTNICFNKKVYVESYSRCFERRELFSSNNR